MCDEEAHNAAWEEVDFEARYREYLGESADAPDALDTLAERVTSGGDVVLVCFEGENKHCHRHACAEFLERRIEWR
jgi:uncharacterized protein YeaO (DUF488 family)